MPTPETLLQAIQNNSDGGVYDHSSRALTTATGHQANALAHS
ncbi:hypothetical protein MJO29_009923 [Puccinia striiformis f. sp. tritici]|nr:hypothetical protein MJO29_009923 [Puccinia striiformis f. sp. tritici]